MGNVPWPMLPLRYVVALTLDEWNVCMVGLVTLGVVAIASKGGVSSSAVAAIALVTTTLSVVVIANRAYCMGEPNFRSLLENIRTSGYNRF